MDDELHPKICDFGFSKIINNKIRRHESIVEMKGTVAYIAPEIISHINYTKEADVYSFGFIVFEIMTSELPFKGFDEFRILQKVSKGYRPTIPTYVPSAYSDLIMRCWSQNPEDRPSFDEMTTNSSLIKLKVKNLKSILMKLKNMIKSLNPKKLLTKLLMIIF